MAHHPMFGPDPAKPASSAAEGRVESGAVSPAAGAAGESDLADLVAKFAARGGGRVSAEVSAELALEVVLNEIVEQACLATGASGAAIVLERGGEWVCRASAGGTAPELGARLDTEAGLSGACMQTWKVQRCDDAQADPRADIQACRNLGVRSVIILPMLQNGELAGVFELFSSWPSAFGERDERTLEALSQRVLKNLERATEPLSASVKPAEGVPAEVANIIAESLSAENISAGNRDATSDADYRSLKSLLLQPANDAASGRAINLITWVLGAAVLAFAVLLTVLAGQRLGGGKVRARAHAPAAVSSPPTGAENRSAAGSASTGSAASTSGNKSAGSSAPPSGSVVPVSRATHTADSSAPAGSLLVYENGREVFRMPPTAGQGEATSATGTKGTDAYGTEVQRASAVEAAGILEVPPEVAEGSLLHRVEPDYPAEARQQQMQGPVVLDVRIGRDGAIQEVNLLSGQRLLADAAIAAVKQWRFKPRVINGQPVETQTKVTLNFRLPH
jgi:TonB family protein